MANRILKGLKACFARFALRSTASATLLYLLLYGLLQAASPTAPLYEPGSRQEGSECSTTHFCSSKSALPSNPFQVSLHTHALAGQTVPAFSWSGNSLMHLMNFYIYSSTVRCIFAASMPQMRREVSLAPVVATATRYVAWHEEKKMTPPIVRGVAVPGEHRGDTLNWSMWWQAAQSNLNLLLRSISVMIQGWGE